MSANPDFGFGKFVPGFDFLQNLAKGTAQATPGGLSSWVAPTLNVEELDKRISELKAVAFWLEQNGKALAATIQALEVQKMTLATLQGMNVNMGEMAEAMKARTVEAVDGMQKMTQAAAGAVADAAPAARKAAAGNGGGGAAGAVDPLQWWGALTQQFQQIAASALQEVAQAVPPEMQRAAQAVAAGAPAAKSAPAKSARPPRSAARKATPRKASPRR